MQQHKLEELADLIANHRCVLFAGAGLTLAAGGITWVDLIKYLSEKFKYKSPLEDKFMIMGDMCRKYGDKVIYEAVQERLKNVKIPEMVLPLASWPWFTVFTTNYDTALEEALRENQKLSVSTVLTGREFSLMGLSSQMLCVKLMGSVDVNFCGKGAMVLDPGDLSLAKEERYRIFDELAACAANLTFLFVGCSLSDGVFLETLDKLYKLLGGMVGRYYVVVQEEPDEKTKYLFEQLGVDFCVEDLGIFVENLEKIVKVRSLDDFSVKSIPLFKRFLPVKVNKIAGFLSLYHPVISDDFKHNIDANLFLKGNLESFRPFELGWHFNRRQKKKY